MNVFIAIVLTSIVAAFACWAWLIWGQQREPATDHGGMVTHRTADGKWLQMAVQSFIVRDGKAYTSENEWLPIPRLGEPHPSDTRLKVAHHVYTPTTGLLTVLYKAHKPITPAISRRRWAAYKPKVA